MQSVGVIALICSVLAMMVSFVVGFGELQLALATLSLAFVIIAATILLRDPDINERSG